MVLGFALLLAAYALINSGWTGRGIGAVLRGMPGGRGFALSDVNVPDVAFQAAPASSQTGGGGTQFASFGGGGGSVSGSPKDIIDNIVIPIARQAGINVSAASVAAANARHGPTISGGRSDHQGPPSRAWAADMSNGSSPTKEMDRLAAALADRFGIPWSGSGAKSVTRGRYRYQMIYRSDTGGNHFNHVHFGVRAN